MKPNLYHISIDPLPVQLLKTWVGLPPWSFKHRVHSYLCSSIAHLQTEFLSISSVQISRSVMSDSFQPHESQHARPPCPSPTPGVYSNSCPLSRWCHPAISSSVIPFSSCPQCLPASGSFPVSQLFAWGGQSIGVSASASVLPVNTQDWSPLGWMNQIGGTKSEAGQGQLRVICLQRIRECMVKREFKSNVRLTTITQLYIFTMSQ